MNIIEERRMLCPCCMEKHEVELIEDNTTNIYKGKYINYSIISFYCPIANEFWEDEDMITKNYYSMIKEYQRKYANDNI